MASCPKCGKHITRKRKDGRKHCRRHGPLTELKEDVKDDDKSSKPPLFMDTNHD